ncbi:MAG TPA: AraC family transcriptional regulator, partial [Syntrophales bacterium]|nr:AraC family transcriptional regulator [Syntrophales bacterium]
MTKGSRLMRYREVSIVIPEKTLFVINPREAHACESDDPEHSYLVISAPPDALKAVAAQMSRKTQPVTYFKQTPMHDVELYLKMERFFTLIDKKGSERVRESMMLSLLSQLMLRYAEEPPTVCNRGLHARTIWNVCEFIKKHHAEPLSLKQLSAEAQLSPFYFQRLFLEKTGISPHDYLAQVRIGKAKQLLAAGHAIAHVALDVGFVDQSHFTRVFQKLNGVTPGGYVTMI